MRDTNIGVVYPNAEIKEVVPQEFTIGNRSVVDPVGMQAEMLEANFINIIARTTLEENIRKCVRGAGLEVQEVLVSPLCEANALLTANERRSGCALVDMGADTTTVSVYTNNILRHLCVIPLGGSNVTSDLTSLKIEAEEAEELKKKYGTAYRSDNEDKTGQKVSLSFDRTEDEEKLQEIVEARYEEIIANVCHHISAYKDKMLSGIVITGGAARIPDLQRAYARQTAGDMSLRIVKGMPQNVTVSFGVQVGDPDRLNTLYALLLAGKENCVGEASETPAQGELDFDNKQQDEEPEEVLKPEEPDEPEKPVEQEKPKKPSTFSRFWQKLGDMLSDESEREENS
jgi:cell division protein FtsA